MTRDIEKGQFSEVKELKYEKGKVNSYLFCIGGCN
jgi:hypothetical protein